MKDIFLEKTEFLLSKYLKLKEIYIGIGTEVEFYIESQNTLLTTNKEIIKIKEKISKIANKNNVSVSELEKEDGLNQFEIQTDPVNSVEDVTNFIKDFQELAKKNKINIKPKPFKDQPGNGMHIHISIYNGKDNQNIFFHKKKNYSLTMKQSIAGILMETEKNIMSLITDEQDFERFAIERKNEMTFKHNPSTISWGINNRTCAIRIPKKTQTLPKDTRIEYRIPSSSANIDKVMKLILYGILKGIKNKLPCPAPIYGDAFNVTEYPEIKLLPFCFLDTKT